MHLISSAGVTMIYYSNVIVREQSRLGDYLKCSCITLIKLKKERKNMKVCMIIELKAKNNFVYAFTTQRVYLLYINIIIFYSSQRYYFS